MLSEALCVIYQMPFFFFKHNSPDVLSNNRSEVWVVRWPEIKLFNHGSFFSPCRIIRPRMRSHIVFLRYVFPFPGWIARLKFFKPENKILRQAVDITVLINWVIQKDKRAQPTCHKATSHYHWPTIVELSNRHYVSRFV